MRKKTHPSSDVRFRHVPYHHLGGFCGPPKKTPGQVALSESLLNITDLASASKTSQPHAEFQGLMRLAVFSIFQNLVKDLWNCETSWENEKIQQIHTKIANNTSNSNDSSSWLVFIMTPPSPLRKDFHWPHCHGCLALSLIPWPYMLISSWKKGQRCSFRKLLGRASFKTPHPGFVIWKSLKCNHIDCWFLSLYISKFL